MRVGVLALQGAFIEHIKMLNDCGCETFEIRQRNDIEKAFDGLVLPGGESTVIGKLMKDLQLLSPLKDKILEGLPVMGTCAGLILLAKNVENDDISRLDTMSITVKRNAYGRQLGSFQTIANFKGIGEIPMTFIRAPYIESVEDAEILATVNGKIVSARQNNQLAVAFHPELTNSKAVHQYFLNMIKERK